jgi:enoyl-CoA hydratase/carnithine racemase
MEYENIKVEYGNKIATITLNRPEKRNPLSFKTVHELMQAFDEVESSGKARVVILTGAGLGFCSGMSADDFKDGQRVGIGEHESLTRLYDLLVLRIKGLELPTIAAVNGAAIGGGFGLAIACDIRVASENVRIGAIFIRRGASAAGMGATYILPRLVGPAWAVELMLTGEVIDAAKAERVGLFTHVVPQDQLMPVACDLAAKIAAGPPLGLKFTKRALYRSIWEGLQGEIEYEAAVQTLCTMSEDFMEGWKAYFEKREPEFKGY